MVAKLGAEQFVRYRDRQSEFLAIALAVAAIAYVGWKIGQSPEQALQFAFNGMSVGAVYALLAMGFTLVYSTVWFFDLYYGAAAAIGAYGVFYLRSGEALGGQYQVNEPLLNIAFAAITAGVVAWTLYARGSTRGCAPATAGGHSLSPGVSSPPAREPTWASSSRVRTRSTSC